jgi:hypothetical protein
MTPSTFFIFDVMRKNSQNDFLYSSVPRIGMVETKARNLRIPGGFMIAGAALVHIGPSFLH